MWKDWTSIGYLVKLHPSFILLFEFQNYDWTTTTCMINLKKKTFLLVRYYILVKYKIWYIKNWEDMNNILHVDKKWNFRYLKNVMFEKVQDNLQKKNKKQMGLIKIWKRKTKRLLNETSPERITSITIFSKRIMTNPKYSLNFRHKYVTDSSNM